MIPKPAVTHSSLAEFTVDGVRTYKHTYVALSGNIKSGTIGKDDKVYLYRDSDGAMIVAAKVLNIICDDRECLSAGTGQKVEIVIDQPLNNVSKCSKVIKKI